MCDQVASLLAGRQPETKEALRSAGSKEANLLGCPENTCDYGDPHSIDIYLFHPSALQLRLQPHTVLRLCELFGFRCVTLWNSEVSNSIQYQTESKEVYSLIIVCSLLGGMDSNGQESRWMASEKPEVGL